MRLLQYFGWVGSFLLAALLAANWCFSSPIAPPPRSDVPLDLKINIRIHTDHKWPERVVFGTTRSTLAQKADAQTYIGRSQTPVLAERQPSDAFAEMTTIPVKPCFRAPCPAVHAAERDASPIERGSPSQNRSRPSTVARNGLTFPNRLHKPQGRS